MRFEPETLGLQNMQAALTSNYGRKIQSGSCYGICSLAFKIKFSKDIWD